MRAVPGDEIRMASGTYTDVNNYGGLAQVVYSSKTVTIRGYTINWTTPYPITQPTTLYAQGQGQVIHITGNISPTIENLRITGGYVKDYYGDGLYLWYSSAILSGNAIYANSAQQNGGGLCLGNSDITLIGNAIYVNTAGGGGGTMLVPHRQHVQRRYHTYR